MEPSESTAFSELSVLMSRLLGPNGCPWDQVQTLETLRPYVLEEACEVIEAINLKDPQLLCEELGDLLLNIIFFSKLAEKEGWFSLTDVMKRVHDKLVIRHAHVFGKNKLAHADEVVTQWQAIKEKTHQRTGLFEGIPHEMPALAQAEKMVKKWNKTGKDLPKLELSSQEETQVAEQLLEIVKNADSQKMNAEQALRAFLALWRKCESV